MHMLLYDDLCTYIYMYSVSLLQVPVHVSCPIFFGEESQFFGSAPWCGPKPKKRRLKLTCLRTNLSRRFFAYGFRYAAEPKKLCPRSTPAAAQRTQRTVTYALSPCLCAGTGPWPRIAAHTRRSAAPRGYWYHNGLTISISIVGVGAH